MNRRVRGFIEQLFSSNELNRLPKDYGGGRIFAKPLVGVSRGDDRLFQRFKEVVAPEHLTPAEMWVQSGLSDESNLAARLRVVSIVFPYVSQIRGEGEKSDEDMPPEIYCLGRNFANPFMDDVLKQATVFFQRQGFRATSGMGSRAFQILTQKDPFRIYSIWSERHIAFAAGLGTFSLHEGLITEAGCNVRVASVITDAPLEAAARISDEPYANCLHFAEAGCGKCIAKCPAGAISKEGHDKLKCYLYLQEVKKEMHGRPLRFLLKPGYRTINGKDETSYAVGCALCQFGVPCTSKNPMASRGKVLERQDSLVN
jgi:epoxyqueuosine reductase QueG